jgi:integrase/recombinase XerD
MVDPSVERPIAVGVPVEALFSDDERAALVGFLAGHSGRNRVEYTLDLRQYTSWCATHGLHLFAAKRADIECYASEVEVASREQGAASRAEVEVHQRLRGQRVQQLIDHMDQIDRSHGVDLPCSDSVRVD